MKVVFSDLSRLRLHGIQVYMHYRILGDTVQIITIAHTSQRPPQLS